MNIGYIFQDYKLVDSMTVYENVAMALRMIGIKDEAEIKKRIDYVLETLGIYRYRNRMADMLSGGERQRIAIARAILKDAPIVILDEATSSVDPENEHLLLAAIRELTAGKTLISIAHRLSTVRNAQAILVLEQGQIIERGNHKTLLAQKGKYYQLYTGQSELS